MPKAGSGRSRTPRAPTLRVISGGQSTRRNRDPETKEREEEVTRFSRYRQTEGIQWPQQIHRERNGEKVYEIFSESVTVNQGLADNLFAVPGPDAKPDPPRKK